MIVQTANQNCRSALRHFSVFRSAKPVLQRRDLDGCAEEHGYTFNTRNSLSRVPLNEIGLPEFRLPHMHWKKEELLAVEQTHREVKSLIDMAAYATVKLLRTVYDTVSLYATGYRSESMLVTRVMILETVAAIPGMVGAFFRHMNSLRKFAPDYGYINALLAEAENERMHLLTAMLLKNPGSITRVLVSIAQVGFTAWYALCYLICPKFCHRFVGYLEEEAVHTYTDIVNCINSGKLKKWINAGVPEAARAYWRMPKDAKMVDLWLNVRADEMHHREVNHAYADSDGAKAINPYPFGLM